MISSVYSLSPLESYRIPIIRKVSVSIVFASFSGRAVKTLRCTVNSTIWTTVYQGANIFHHRRKSETDKAAISICTNAYQHVHVLFCSGISWSCVRPCWTSASVIRSIYIYISVTFIENPPKFPTKVKFTTRVQLRHSWVIAKNPPFCTLYIVFCRIFKGETCRECNCGGAHVERRKSEDLPGW